jgi:flavin reductase (DIM6/NTAB) family NADH-FMN oxidoreductase RutF
MDSLIPAGSRPTKSSAYLPFRQLIVYEVSMQKVLGLLDGTAWIITSSSAGDSGGLVATFVNNASLVPALPRLVTGIARHHYTWELIQRSRAFAAHLVDEHQCELIWKFGLASGRHVNKFADVKWRRGQTGSPVLEDALAWVDCSVEAELDIGDRTLYVAAVVDAGVSRPGAALTEKRILELANQEQRSRMEEQRRRDEKLDAEAMLAWRANTGGDRPRPPFYPTG